MEWSLDVIAIDTFMCIEKKINSKVTVHRDLQGCKTSRLSHFLDSPLSDGSEVVSLTRRSRFTTHEDSWYLSLPEAEGYSAAKRIS
jgi:hypothetical protein